VIVGGFWSGALVGLGQSLPSMGYSVLKGMERGLQGAVGGGLAGGAVGAAAGGVGAVPGAAAGMATGGLVGSRFGFLEGQFKVQTGLALNEFSQFRDEEGKPLDPNLVKWAAVLAGAGGAGLEATGAMATIGQIPGMDKVLGQLTIPGIKGMLAQPGLRGALTNFAARYASGVTIETITEGLQEGLLIIAGETAKAASDGSFKELTGEEAAQRLAEATYKGFQVATLLGGLSSGTRLGADLMHMNRSKKRADELKSKAVQLEDNAFLERAPDVAAKVIDAQSGGQTVYIPADKFMELYQSLGQDPYGPPLPNWRARVDDAFNTGGDIRVSLGEFIAHLGKNPKDNPLFDIVRTDPNDYVSKEMRIYSEGMNEVMASEVQKAELARAVPETEVPAEPSVVREQISEMLTQVGYTPEAVQHLSTMLGLFYETLADKEGKTPEQVFQEYAVDIRKGMDEGQVDTTSPYSINPGGASAYAVRNPKEQGVSPDGELDAVDFDEVDDSRDDLYQGPIEPGTYTGPEAPAIQVGGKFFTGSRHSEALAEAVAYFGPDSPEITAFEAMDDPLQSLGILRPERGFIKEALDLGKPGGFRAKISGDNGQGIKEELQKIKETRYEQLNRGSIRFRKGGPTVITLFETADMSTLLHEAGHFFLETMKSVAKTNEGVARDFQIIAKELGLEGDRITVDQHEKFARMTEAYFMQGKAPTPELASAFAKFKSWLTFIYRQIKTLGGRVNPEIAGVFDRMFATEARLAELQQDKAYAPLFQDAETFGLDPQEYLAYQQLVEDLRSQAVDKVRGRIVGQEARLQKGWMKEVERELTREFEAKLVKQPPYSHTVAFTSKGFSISKKDFQDRYGEEATKKFPKTAFTKEGLDPSVAAELLGYPTADDMVYDFVQAPKLKDAAKEMAKAEMVKRFGEDTLQPDILDLAVKRELAEDGRANLLAKEYRALSAKAGRTVSENGPRQMAKEIVLNSLYRKKVKDVNDKVTQAAARRAASMAESLTLKGNWTEAADWKRKQLIAQTLDNETQKLNRTIQKIRDKAAKYTRKAYPSIDPQTMEQIRSLVTRFDFVKLSGPKLVEKQTLRDYMEQAQEEGFVIDIDPRFLKDAERLNYKELTVEELLGFGDTLDNLEHIGRNRQKVLTEGRRVEFGAVKDEILQTLEQLPQRARKMKTYTQEEEGLRTYATNFLASALKPEQIVEWLDAGQIAGPMARYVFNNIVAAQDMQNDLNVEYNGKLTKIFEGLDTNRLSEVRHISSLQSNMTMEEIYAVGLNLGNDSNRIKLMQGEVWDESILEEVTSHLQKEDWDRIQQVWDTIESLWPKISAMEKRLKGVEPPKVEARELTTRYGTYKGGYYPVIYDFKAQRGLNLLQDPTPKDRVFMDGLVSNNFIAPGTNHRYTVKRTGAKKPIKLSLAVLPSHIHTVIHDLAYREAVRSAYKILWDPEIKAAISGIEGESTYMQLQHWLRAVATEHAVESDGMIRAVSHIRTGATIYAMGYRLTTIWAQPLGFFNSLVRVGGKHLGPAIYQMTMRPVQTNDWVNAKSGELRHRFNTQDRDIKDTMKKLANSSSRLDFIRHYAFHGIAAMDKYVATATWLGAYRQQMMKNPGNEAEAILFADRTVRLTQGTGNVKDMAKVMNNGEIMKLFTMFYSAFSALYNMQVDLTRKTKRDIADDNWHTVLSERLPQWMYLVALPAVVGALIGGQGPDEDESKAAWMLRKILLYPMAAVPFVRDIVGAAESGFGYKPTGAFKAFEETSKALERLFEGNLEGAIKPAVVSTSIALKLPAGQAVSSVEGLYKGLVNGDLEYKDLVYGRRDK
jgi:hypothetical protein